MGPAPEPIAPALREYYARRASEYERVYDKPERQADLRRLEREIPAMLAGRRVLEVACGTGYWTRFLAREAARVVAIDASVQTLAIAVAKGLPAQRVDFVEGDAYALAESLGSFDGAFAGFWWSHVPIREQPRFLASLGRRLEPGARIVLLDNLYVEGSSTPICERDADGNTYQSRRLVDGSVHRVIKNFPTAGELRAAAGSRAAGFEWRALEYYWVCTWLAPA
jgi:demethylmenaquinone methyltransferase/2-methoxy-6-polyprenyl-1,4-benzoquinol methylase